MYTAKNAREGVHVYVARPRRRQRRPAAHHGGAAHGTRQRRARRPPASRRSRLTDGRVVGVEALVRWNHPTRGLLSPAQLLPAAEQAGLLRPLTDTVLELAARRRRPLVAPAAGADLGQPLGAPTSTTSTCPSKVAAALARHGLPAAALTLELVEDTLMADPERGRQVLGELRRLGIRTSIDDYGTGYSSWPTCGTCPPTSSSSTGA